MTYRKHEPPRTDRGRFARDLMVTVGAILGASLFRVLLAPVLYDRAAFQVFTLAVMISAWTGGWRTGVVATVLASFVGAWLFVSPFDKAKVHDVQDIAQTLLFAATGCGISILAGKLHKARRAAETQARNATRMRDELSDFLESISESFQALDRKFHLLYMNEAAERITGKDFAAEMIGQPVWNQFPATIGARVKLQLREVMASRTPLSSEYRDESTNRWYLISVYPFRDGVSVLARDISGKKSQEVERERMVIELQQALAQVRTLRGLIPICAWCKRIRDDRGYWQQLEAYIRDHSEQTSPTECARTVPERWENPWAEGVQCGRDQLFVIMTAWANVFARARCLFSPPSPHLSTPVRSATIPVPRPLATPPVRPTDWRNRPSASRSTPPPDHAETPLRTHRPRHGIRHLHRITGALRPIGPDAHLAAPLAARDGHRGSLVQVRKQRRLVVVHLHRIGQREQFANQLRRVAAAPQIHVVEAPCVRHCTGSVDGACRRREHSSDKESRNRSSPAATPRAPQLLIVQGQAIVGRGPVNREIGMPFRIQSHRYASCRLPCRHLNKLRRSGRAPRPAASAARPRSSSPTALRKITRCPSR